MRPVQRRPVPVQIGRVWRRGDLVCAVNVRRLPAGRRQVEEEIKGRLPTAIVSHSAAREALSSGRTYLSLRRTHHEHYGDGRSGYAHSGTC